MNGSLSPDNIIQKSRPLLAELKQAKLSVTELKLIEIYLSKINAYWELSYDNSEKERTVKFSSQDLKELFKKKIDISHIKQSLDNIHSIKVRNAFEEGTKSTERTIVLFEKSELTIDDNGISEITLTCSQSAMQYIFDIENLGFLQYKLKNVLYLKSKYSYTLFLYLLDNKFRKSWEIDFDELRELLKTNYTTYAEINKLILKPCLQEIKANTNLNYNYAPIKRGRTIIRIEFTVTDWGEVKNIVNKIEQPIIDEFNTVSSQVQSVQPQVEQNERTAFFSECFDNTFSTLQVQLLMSSVNSNCIIRTNYGADIDKYSYLNRMYKRLRVEEQDKQIANRFKYFLSMIENDKGGEV